MNNLKHLAFQDIDFKLKRLVIYPILKPSYFRFRAYLRLFHTTVPVSLSKSALKDLLTLAPFFLVDSAALQALLQFLFISFQSSTPIFLSLPFFAYIFSIEFLPFTIYTDTRLSAYLLLPHTNIYNPIGAQLLKLQTCSVEWKPGAVH